MKTVLATNLRILVLPSKFVCVHSCGFFYLAKSRTQHLIYDAAAWQTGPMSGSTMKNSNVGGSGGRLLLINWGGMREDLRLTSAKA